MKKTRNSTIPRGTFFTLTIGLGALCIAVIMGCGSDTLLTPELNAGSQFIRVQPDVLQNARGGRNAPTPITVTKRIGILGGTVQAGRHIVTFAPGSLLTSTDITVTDMTPVLGFVECQLFPEGIHFLAPVTLQTNVSDLYSPIGMTMYWLDTSNSLWVDISGAPSPDGQGILSILTHFSTYRPGKAGW